MVPGAFLLEVLTLVGFIVVATLEGSCDPNMLVFIVGLAVGVVVISSVTVESICETVSDIPVCVVVSSDIDFVKLGEAVEAEITVSPPITAK